MKKLVSEIKGIHKIYEEPINESISLFTVVDKNNNTICNYKGKRV